jgi:hypothetical protein
MRRALAAQRSTARISAVSTETTTDYSDSAQSYISSQPQVLHAKQQKDVQDPLSNTRTNYNMLPA